MLKLFKADITDEGVVSSVISTFGVVDHDGDVTSKSSFPDDGHPVIMSAYNHQSWKGALPIGYGSITTTDTEAHFKGQFLMDTTHGVDAFRTVKALSGQDLQEWSYSLRDIKSSATVVKGKSARHLDSFEVAEVSPVIKGASIGTRTIDIKSVEGKQLSSMLSRLLADAGDARWGASGSYVYLDDFDIDSETAVFCVRNWDTGTRESYQVDFTRTDTSVVLGDAETAVVSTTAYLPKGLKFSEHSNLVLTHVGGLIERANEVMTLRAEKGKSISEESKAQLVVLRDQLEKLLQTATPPIAIDEELQSLFLKSMRQLQETS